MNYLKKYWTDLKSATEPSRHLWPLIFVTLVFLRLAIYLLTESFNLKPFSEELLIYDLIWLDGWALLFYFSLVVVWISRISRRSKARMIVALLAVHGLVAVALTFDGTMFSFNGYWGDQKFRQAMILKLFEFGWFTDFYYKGLPPFYPPLYYFLLALYSKIFSLEIYKMLKVGSLYIYAIGPFLLYWLWRKIVTPTQAALITIFSFLFCSIGKGSPLIAPHAFIANSIFIPWWLYYVEQVRGPLKRWSNYLSGGLIGGLIFMTYYYPFFIGGVLLILRMTILRKWSFANPSYTGHIWRSIKMLCAAALFSSPFWLPLMWTVLTRGSNPAQQEWHHIGSTGIAFPFLGESIPAVLFLLGLVYILRRSYSPVARALLTLVGTTVFFYLCGAFLGAIDRPVNLIKANEFMLFFAGPVIGLAAAGLIRRGQMSHKRRHLPAIIVSLTLIVFLHNMNGFAKKEMVLTGRKAKVASWVETTKIIAEHPGSVFLSNNEELYSFYPVFSFLAANQHYSHPSSDYMGRMRFLEFLENVNDPRLLNLALRHNRFDPVDFLMPTVKNGKLEFLFALSNYPNKYQYRTIRFDTSLLSNSTLFEKVNDFPIYRVVDSVPPAGAISAPVQTLGSLVQMRRLRQFLDQDGRDVLDKLYGIDWSGWQDMPVEKPHSFDGAITLPEGFVVTTADSIHFVMVFDPETDIHRQYKVFLHLATDTPDEQFYNFDFTPRPATDRWKESREVVCFRAIPRLNQDFRYMIGFFEGDNRLGKTFSGDYVSPAVRAESGSK